MNKLEEEILEEFINDLNKSLENYVELCNSLQNDLSNSTSWDFVNFFTEPSIASHISSFISQWSKNKPEFNIEKVSEFSISKQELDKKMKDKFKKEIKNIDLGDKEWKIKMIPDIFIKLSSKNNSFEPRFIFIEFKRGVTIKYSDIVGDYLKYKYYSHTIKNGSYFLYIDFKTNQNEHKKFSDGKQYKISINYNANEINYYELNKELEKEILKSEKHIFVYKNKGSNSPSENQLVDFLFNLEKYNSNYNYLIREATKSEELISYENIKNLNLDWFFKKAIDFKPKVIFSHNIVTVIDEITKFYFDIRKQLEKNTNELQMYESSLNELTKEFKKKESEYEKDIVKEREDNNKNGKKIRELIRRKWTEKFFSLFSYNLFRNKLEDVFPQPWFKYSYVKSLTNIVDSLINLVKGKIIKENKLFMEVSIKRSVFILILIQRSYCELMKISYEKVNLLKNAKNIKNEEIYSDEDYDQIVKAIVDVIKEREDLKYYWFFAGLALIVYLTELFNSVLDNEDNQIVEKSDIEALFENKKAFERKNDLLNSYSLLIHARKSESKENDSDSIQPILSKREEFINNSWTLSLLEVESEILTTIVKKKEGN